MADTAPQARTALIWAALAALYLVWGSMYLAVRFSVEAQPPLLSTGARFLVSGLILFAVTNRTRKIPVRRTWVPALAPGILLIGSAGLLAIGEQEVPSGIASLISATIPFFMVLLGATALRQRTGPLEWVGIAVGFAGAALLAGPGGEAPAWALALVAASAFGWAAGSVVAGAAPQEGGLLRAVARQTVAGGAVVILAGLAVGEAGQLTAAAFSLRPLLSWAFLMVASSLVCYPAYVWLLGVARTSLVATYGYVNPVVAVFLGWAVAEETITGRTLLAAALVVGAVALVVSAAPAAGGHGAGPPEPGEDEPRGTLGPGTSRP